MTNYDNLTDDQIIELLSDAASRYTQLLHSNRNSDEFIESKKQLDELLNAACERKHLSSVDLSNLKVFEN